MPEEISELMYQFQQFSVVSKATGFLSHTAFNCSMCQCLKPKFYLLNCEISILFNSLLTMANIRLIGF